MTLRKQHRAWYRELPILEGIAPDGSGSVNVPATLASFPSTGTQPANAPKVQITALVFSNTVDNHWLWTFRLPFGYVGGGTLRWFWYTNATSGNVLWKVGMVSLGGSDAPFTSIFNTMQTTATSVEGTAAEQKVSNMAVTMTGAAADEWVVLTLGRFATDAADTVNSNTAGVVSVMFECQVA